MSKEKEVKNIKIVDMDNNATEVKLVSFANPKKSTLGPSAFGTLNYLGYSKLQDPEHRETLKNSLAALWNKVNNGEQIEVRSEGEWCQLLKDAFGLTDAELGNRGPKWDSIEARTRYKVFVDDVAFEPAYTEKQQAKIEAVEISIPKTETGIVSQEIVLPKVEKIVLPKMEEMVIPKETEEIILPPQPAVADTTQIVLPKPQVVLTEEDMKYLPGMKSNIALGKWTPEQLINSLALKVGSEKATMILSLAQ